MDERTLVIRVLCIRHVCYCGQTYGARHVLLKWPALADEGSSFFMEVRMLGHNG